MRRTPIVLVSLAFLGFGYWLFIWSAISPQARIARPYARQLTAELKHDRRFANVTVSVSNMGSKGPLFLWGTVASEADMDELRRKVAALHYSAGISWNVAVNTNHIEFAISLMAQNSTP